MPGKNKGLTQITIVNNYDVIDAASESSEVDLSLFISLSGY